MPSFIVPVLSELDDLVRSEIKKKLPDVKMTLEATRIVGTVEVRIYYASSSEPPRTAEAAINEVSLIFLHLQFGQQKGTDPSKIRIYIGTIASLYQKYGKDIIAIRIIDESIFRYILRSANLVTYHDLGRSLMRFIAMDFFSRVRVMYFFDLKRFKFEDFLPSISRLNPIVVAFDARTTQALPLPADVRKVIQDELRKSMGEESPK